MYKRQVKEFVADRVDNLTKFGEDTVADPAALVMLIPAPAVSTLAVGLFPVFPIASWPFVNGPKLVNAFEAPPINGQVVVVVLAENVPAPSYFTIPTAEASIELFVGIMS